MEIFLLFVIVGLLIIVIVMLGALQNEWKEMTQALNITSDEIKKEAERDNG